MDWFFGYYFLITWPDGNGIDGKLQTRVQAQCLVVAPTSPWGQGAQMFAHLVNVPVKAIQETLNKAMTAKRGR
jgi:hypothetical protein